MAKNTARQQNPPMSTAIQSASSTPPLPSSHLRQRSPSPKFAPGHQGSHQLGYTRDGYQHPRCPPPSFRSSCPSPSLIQSPPPPCFQTSPSSPISLGHQQSPHSSSLFSHPSSIHSQTYSSPNANNNNNISLAGFSNVSSCNINGAVSNGDWSGTQHRAPLANGSTNATAIQQTHDHLWTGSHNRVARPFSASEPSSRVQSPSPSPNSVSFTRLCSPSPQHNYSSPMANKPPNPRSARTSTSSHNPLGLTLELPKASSSSSTFSQMSSCLSPHILSPPPIGVSVNAWPNNVATPQPRTPRFASSSPCPSFPSSLGLLTLENASYPTTSSSSVQPRSSSVFSPFASCPPASQATSQTLRRSFSSNLADRPPSPAQINSSGLRQSWAESSHRSSSYNGSVRGSFGKQESCPTSPRSGWSSYSSSPSCLSPRAGFHSVLSPSRLTPGKSSLGGQHFTSVPWPDVRELSNKYSSADGLDNSLSSTVIAPSPSPLSSLSHTTLPSPSGSQSEWGDPELEEGNCRSQLICAYIARPSCEQNLSSPCLILSSTDMTTPPPASSQSHVNQQPQVQCTTKTPSTPRVHSPSSSLPLTHSSPTKPGNQKTSYATTVNLQIAGSGRITSFSTAQVSLTQTLQGGAGSGGSGQGQAVRRVSINGLSHFPSPLPQNFNRL